MNGRNVYQKFIDIGSKIICCREKCKDVINYPLLGIIPRVFIMTTFEYLKKAIDIGESNYDTYRKFIKECYPKVIKDLKHTDKKVKVCIIGINPGHILPFEKEIYRDILNKKGIINQIDEKRCKEAFEEIHKIWLRTYFKSPSEEREKQLLKYFINTMLFVQEISPILELKDDDIILWAEVVYCESKNKDLSNETIKRCLNKYMEQVTSMFDANAFILFLGKTDFKKIEKIENIKHLKEKYRIIVIYHPSGYKKNWMKTYFVEGKLRPKHQEALELLKYTKSSNHLKKDRKNSVIYLPPPK